MEGIPAPDVADYKRRKEIELGLSIGSISQPQAKRPKIDKRVYTQQELKIQLEQHKALMGANEAPSAPGPLNGAAVYNAAPQTYAVPPIPLPGMPPLPPGAIPPGALPPGMMPGMPFPG
jgi:hypothetical protein